jgi:hypothetical protein
MMRENGGRGLRRWWYDLGRTNRLEQPTGMDCPPEVVALMSSTYNIGIGIAAGFVLYPFCKLVAGRWR